MYPRINILDYRRLTKGTLFYELNLKRKCISVFKGRVQFSTVLLCLRNAVQSRLLTSSRFPVNLPTFEQEAVTWRSEIRFTALLSSPLLSSAGLHWMHSPALSLPYSGEQWNALSTAAVDAEASTAQRCSGHIAINWRTDQSSFCNCQHGRIRNWCYS